MRAAATSTQGYERRSSRTRIEQFIESDLDARIDARVAPRHLKEDAINAARLTLSVCWFDAAACSEGLKALRSYRKEWDEEKVRERYPFMRSSS